FEVALRYGLAAPAGTPPAIIARLNKELNAALAAEDVKTRLATEGAEALPGTPEIYAADIAAEEKKWGGLVEKLGLKVEEGIAAVQPYCQGQYRHNGNRGSP